LPTTVSTPCRLLRSGRAEAVAPAARAAGNLLRDDLALQLAEALAPALLAALSRVSGAASFDLIYALTNLFSLCPASLTRAEAAAGLAKGLLRLLQVDI